MSRKTDVFVATVDRDKGKRFVITEMPALQAERWALRAILALTHAGAELPEGEKAGFAAIALAGIQSLQKLQFAEVAPLLDEMMDCVKIIPDPKNIDFMRPLVMNQGDGDDIEELQTIFELRERIFRLHAAFFFNNEK